MKLKYTSLKKILSYSTLTFSALSMLHGSTPDASEQKFKSTYETIDDTVANVLHFLNIQLVGIEKRENANSEEIKKQEILAPIAKLGKEEAKAREEIEIQERWEKAVSKYLDERTVSILNKIESEKLNILDNDMMQAVVQLLAEEKAQMTVAIAKTNIRKATENELIAAIKTKEELPSRIDKEYTKIMQQFETETQLLKSKEEQKEKITINFLTGEKVVFRKDVLSFIPCLKEQIDAAVKEQLDATAAKEKLDATADKEKLDATADKEQLDTTAAIDLKILVNPKLFKQLCTFIEAAMTIGKNNEYLIYPGRNSQHQYALFTKNEHISEFVAENRSTIELLSKLGLWQQKHTSPQRYNYSLALGGNNLITDLIATQLYNSIKREAFNNASFTMMNLSNKLVQISTEMNASAYNALTTCADILFTNMSPEFYIDIIEKIKPLDPDVYQPLIDIVDISSQNNLHLRRGRINSIINTLSPTVYRSFANFLRGHRTFFNRVPFDRFIQSININMNRDGVAEILQRMNEAYANGQNAQATQGNNAFEIHNFADQIVSCDGKKLRFNDAVIEKIRPNLGMILPYPKVENLLKTAFSNLLKDRKKSDAITEDMFNRILLNNQSFEDNQTFCTVVSYLIKQDQARLETWLYTYLDESKKAYASGPASCAQGVKERAITSLRAALPDDENLAELFKQGEETSVYKTKRANLNNINFWAKRLFEENVRASTPENDAKEKLQTLLEHYFSDVKTEKTEEEINFGIETLVDGWQSQFIPKLQELETSSTPITLEEA